MTSPIRIPKIEGGHDELAPAWWRTTPECVTLRCPYGHCIRLRTALEGHTIKADGSVHPEVSCIQPSCMFRGMLVLERWTPP